MEPKEYEEPIYTGVNVEAAAKEVANIDGRSDDRSSLGWEEIRNRFGYHKPTEENRHDHIALRRDYRSFAEMLDQVLPPGRAKACALTALEEASMWSHKAIAELAPVIDE